MSDPDSVATAAQLTAEHKADLMHRLRRAEGQMRGLQKLLEDGADCRKIAQQLLATRHTLDSIYVRLTLGGRAGAGGRAMRRRRQPAGRGRGAGPAADAAGVVALMAAL